MKPIFTILFVINILTVSLKSQTWTLDLTPGLNTEAVIARGDTIIVGGANVLQISYDKGNSWEDITVGLPTSPSVRDLLWVGNKLFASINSEGIFVSNNMGLTWQEFNTNLTDLYVGPLASLNQEYLLLGNISGELYKSPIENASWEVVLSINAGIREITTRGEEDIFISAGNTEVLYSANSGLDWTGINEGLPDYGRILTIAINEPVGLICGVEGDGIFKYNFQEEKWEEKNGGVTEVANGENADFYGLILNGENVLFGSQLGHIYLSTNGGESFVDISEDEFVPVYDIALNEDYIYVANVGIRKRFIGDLFTYTNVKEAIENSSFELYPNPSSRYFYIDLAPQTKIGELLVLNSMGEKTNIKTMQTERSIRLDLDNSPPGIYFVLSIPDGTTAAVIKKIIKI